MSAFDKKAKQAEKDKKRREQVRSTSGGTLFQPGQPSNSPSNQPAPLALASLPPQEAIQKRAKKEAEKQKKLDAQKEAQKKKSAEGALKKASKLTSEQVALAEQEAALVAATLERMRLKEEKALSAKAAAARTMAAVQGDAELFKPKMSKEEKKLEAERKKREREMKRALEEGGDKEELEEGEKKAAAQAREGLGEKKKKGGKKTVLEKAAEEQEAVESELELARTTSARARREKGAYMGHLETKDFTLDNPGGGMPLLEDASCILVRGHTYGLIGRNGKGKSTMLRAFAARRVGDVPDNVCVHYVSQEVKLTERTKKMTPAQCVVDADVERKLLLQESKEMEEAAAKGDLDAAGQAK
jgi:hypothetical protein